PRFQPLGTPRLDGVNAIVPSQTMLPCPLARFGEIDRVQRPHAHRPSPAVQHESENQILRAIVSDAQIEPSAVTIHSGPGVLVVIERRELADYSRHFYNPQFCP